MKPREPTKMSEPKDKDWIVMAGQPIDTTKGGGFEFFGPFTEAEANLIRQQMVSGYRGAPGTFIALAVELLPYRASRAT